MKSYFTFLIALLLTMNALAQNHCLNFDGVDDYVDLGDSVGNVGIRTIEMWFKPDVHINASSHSNYTSLIARNNSSEVCEFALFFSELGADANDGKLAFGLNVSNGNYHTIYSDQNSWTAGTWYHVAATVDSLNGMAMYINGVQQAQTDLYGAAPCAKTDITTLGRWGDLAIRHFDGSLDEVRLWDIPRTQAAIQADMQQELVGNEPNLVAYYNFNQGLPAGNNPTVTTLTSATGNFDGNLTNFALVANASNWLCSQTFSDVDFSNALHFDGIDDYVDLGTQVGDTSLRAFELWFRPDVTIDANSNNDYTALIARNNSIEECEFALFFSELGGAATDGKLAFGLNVNNGNYHTIYSDANVWQAGVWHHVVGNVDTIVGMQLYVDGVLQTQTDPYNAAPCATGDVTAIGRWGDLDIRHFQGTIDEVRLWNFPRSQAAIQAAMNHELTAYESGLVAYYNFNQGESGGNNPTVTTLVNLTSNSLHGSLMNFALTGPTSNWICTDAVIPTALAPHMPTAGLDIYPNPASDRVYVGLEGGVSYRLQMFDLSGRLLRASENYDPATPLDLSGLESGLYFIVLQHEAQQYEGKLMIQTWGK